MLPIHSVKALKAAVEKVSIKQFKQNVFQWFRLITLQPFFVHFENVYVQLLLVLLLFCFIFIFTYANGSGVARVFGGVCFCLSVLPRDISKPMQL